MSCKVIHQQENISFQFRHLLVKTLKPLYEDVSLHPGLAVVAIAESGLVPLEVARKTAGLVCSANNEERVLVGAVHVGAQHDRDTVLRNLAAMTLLTTNCQCSLRLRSEEEARLVEIVDIVGVETFERGLVCFEPCIDVAEPQWL